MGIIHDDIKPGPVSTAMAFAGPLIVAAMWDGFQRHGKITTDPVRAAAILTEEVGEVVKESLALTRKPTINGARERMVRELAQVAGVAIWMIANHAIESDFINDDDSQR